MFVYEKIKGISTRTNAVALHTDVSLSSVRFLPQLILQQLIDRCTFCSPFSPLSLSFLPLTISIIIFYI